MAEVRVAHTAMLSPDDLRAIRALLDDSFDDMTDDDYEHALGGMHALVPDGAELIGLRSVPALGMPMGPRRTLSPACSASGNCVPRGRRTTCSTSCIDDSSTPSSSRCWP
jgi:hypothetical protein